VVVTRIHDCREPDLAHIRLAGHDIGLIARLAQRWQKNRNQQRDDPNYHEQFNERKSCLIGCRAFSRPLPDQKPRETIIAATEM
jgi:hypothetical protein